MINPWVVPLRPGVSPEMKIHPLRSIDSETPMRKIRKFSLRIGALSSSEKVRLTLMYIYCVHIFANAIAGSVRTASIMYIIETLTYTTRSAAATLSFSYVCFNRAEWTALRADLMRTNCTELSRKAEVRRIILRVCVLVYCCALILTTALFFVLVPAQKYFDKCFYGLILEDHDIPNAAAIFIGLIEWNWYNTLVTTSPLLVADLIQLAHLMRAQIRDFRIRCRRLGVSRVGQLQDSTNRLTSLMQRIESFYSPLVFLWTLDLLTNIVLPIRTLVNGIASFTLANVMHFFIEASYSAVFFFLMSFSLAEIAKESLATDEELYLLRTGVPDTSTDFTQIFSKLSLLESGLVNCKFTISGFGLFEVDRSFILTLAGAVTTYTIVLVQLAPGDTY